MSRTESPEPPGAPPSTWDWPSFSGGDAPESLAFRQRFGGTVFHMAPSPDARGHAVLWTTNSKSAPYPWVRLAVVGADGAVAWSPRSARLRWGRRSAGPSWSPSGHLAVEGYLGIRRVVFDVDVSTAELTVVAGSDAASYSLLTEYVDRGSAVCRRTALDGTETIVRVTDGHEEPVGEPVADSRARPTGWSGAELVRWQHRGGTLEGLFVPPGSGRPPWPTMTFLHGGPMNGLVAGEQERAGGWTCEGWATFLPDYPASGIWGQDAQTASLECRELPDEDHEVAAITAGVDALIAEGRVDPDCLVLVGHSYGGYLVNRAVTSTDRFRAAVCWEGVADLRALDDRSLRMQSVWRGGSPEEAPERWSAASPIDRANRVRTPMLLVYGGQSGIDPRHDGWYDALRAAGAEAELYIDEAAGHQFTTDEQRDAFQERVRLFFECHAAGP